MCSLNIPDSISGMIEDAETSERPQCRSEQVSKDPFQRGEVEEHHLRVQTDNSSYRVRTGFDGVRDQSKANRGDRNKLHQGHAVQEAKAISEPLAALNIRDCSWIGAAIR